MANKNRIKTNGKSYRISDSPFYRLRSKSKLSRTLNESLSSLKKLCNDEHYEPFELAGKNGKLRTIEKPSILLDRIHTRIASLLCRIEVPAYIHSGKKNHSHITNAAAHINSSMVLTMDIQKFYPSTTAKHVFNFFYQIMECSPDVSGLLAKLITFDGHIPTGSRVSLVIAYWSNHRLYEELYAAAQIRNVIMTVYVDDLTFSGEHLSRRFSWEVEKITRKHGLKIHPDKTCLFKKSDTKIITGVVIKDGKLLIKNEQHLKTYQDIESWKVSKQFGSIPESLLSRLQGRLISMSAIEPKYKDKFRSIKLATISK